MFKMFAQFFAMITELLSAGEKGARSLNALATAGEEAALEFAAKSRVERMKQQAALDEETKVLLEQARLELTHSKKES